MAKRKAKAKPKSKKRKTRAKKPAKTTTKRKTKAKRKVARKPVKKKAKAKKRRRNEYARRTKKDLAENGPSLHTNGFNLTDKQMLFVKHYLGAANLNATEAARMAGYSAKSVNSQGPALLRNPQVKHYIRKRQDDRNRRHEVTEDKIVRELATLAFAEPGEFAEWDGDDLTIKSSRDIRKELRGAIKSLEPVITKWGRALKITFYDKVAAMQLLMQHRGMLNESTRDSDKGKIMKMFDETHAEADKMEEDK